MIIVLLLINLSIRKNRVQTKTTKMEIRPFTLVLLLSLFSILQYKAQVLKKVNHTESLEAKAQIGRAHV